ncbi:hypothetical protein K1719_038457 [Acacia pycnantha]|nr:hypothetical protein K1719_038457 [Acacia pycnantha]
MDSEEESRLLSHEDARLDRQQMIKEEKDQKTSDEEGKKSQKPSSSYSELHSGISSEGKKSQKPSSSYSELHSGISKIMIKGASVSTPDDDLKKYWNTRVKRMQRYGIPIYLPEVCQWVRIQENQNMGNLMSGASQHSEISQDGNFKSYDFSRAYAFGPSGLDIPDSSLFQQPVGLPYNDLVFGNSAKQLSELDMFYYRVLLENSSSCVIPANANYPAEPPLLSSPNNLPLDPNYLFLGDNLHGSHAALNGTFSSLAPIPEAMTPELPSLQYLETQQGSWDANASPLPSLESADTMFQSSPVEQYQSFAVTPDSDGLTETELDTNSPFGHSSASVQTVYTPPVSISSVDDPHHMEHTRAGHEMRQEAISQGATHVGHSQETSSQIDLTTWADSLLDLGWSGNETSDL